MQIDDERQRRIDEARASYPRINMASIPGDEVLIDKPLDAARRLLAYARTARDMNSREWLEGLADEINQCAASIGEPIRVQHVRGEIREMRIVG